MEDEWVPTTYTMRRDVAKMEGLPVTIELMGSPFYKGIKWAVRCAGRCLSIQGEWQFEPQPSSRTKHFYRKYRFPSLEAARKAAGKAKHPIYGDKQ